MENEDSEDQRDIELNSLSAIFPEIQRVHEDDPYTVALELPVKPTRAVTVFFPAPAEVAAAPAPAPAALQAGPANQIDSQELSYLPPIRLEISLPNRYPEEQPPSITVSTAPAWLLADVAKRLAEDGERLWEELGRDLVVFTYIDHMQQAAEDIFGMIDEKGTLQIDPQHKIAVLDYDIKARRAAFERETFDCGICLEPKKGATCHRMIDCGHVFCTQCLQDFYNNAIQEGDLVSVRCLAPNCSKERQTAAQKKTTSKRKKRPKAFINPSELLQIPLEQNVVKRYVMLKYKTELESDKNTIYCPREWCKGAARSKKHRKPEGLDFVEASDDSEEEDEQTQENTLAVDAVDSKNKPSTKRYNTSDMLAICEECGLAFCSRCYQSWHGEFFRCTPRRDKEEFTAEEQASVEYMKLHTTPCPTCDAPAQKTHGCNHMICFRCQTHFCYLCSAWLDPENPYQHFNAMPGGQITGCHQRLWELEGGDGDNVDYGFAGGLVDEAADAPGVPQIEIEEFEDELDNAPQPHAAGPRNAVGPAAAHGQDRRAGVNRVRVEVAREGPLVLRIDADPVPPPPPPPAVPAARAAPGARRRQQDANPGPVLRGRGGGGGRRRQGRGRGGAARQPEPAEHAPLPDQHIQARARNPGPAPVPPALPAAAPGPAAAPALNEEQEAWIRNFVQLALDDNEDLIDSDDEGGDEDEADFWLDPGNDFWPDRE